MTRLGKFMKKVRKEKGFTLADVAEAMGVAISVAHSIENGIIKRPPDARLKAFAKKARIKQAEIFSKLTKAQRAA